MTNPTPMTPEAAPIHNGHILLGQELHDLEDLFVQPQTGDSDFRWCAFFKIGGRLQSLSSGQTFTSKADCLADANRNGCAPSFSWMQKNYLTDGMREVPALVANHTKG